jgi:SAM-dependent methyltransferase
MQDQFNLHFPLHLGNAEETPFDDASFDLALSEYGASIWCDPYKWIPEAARLLRPGGELMFFGNSTLLMLCTPDEPEGVVEDTPATTCLERPLFGMHRVHWNDTSTECHISPGEMIRLRRDSGFEVLDLVEIRPPDGSTTTYPYVTLEWAQKWPAEQAWKARKR